VRQIEGAFGCEGSFGRDGWLISRLAAR
jgi:hypothetical protein